LITAKAFLEVNKINEIAVCFFLDEGEAIQGLTYAGPWIASSLRSSQ
jgi:hypothetical protein